MLRPHRVLVCGVALTLAIGAPPTRGQQGDLPVDAQPLSAADEAAVQAYVNQNVSGLTSADHARAQAARDRLMDPALAKTSVGFRLYYSQRLADALGRMISPSEDPWRAQLAMSVAGAVATDSTLALLLKALDDPRPAVRLAAARELGTLLDQVDQDGRAAVQQARIGPAIATLRDALINEREALVAGELAKALGAPTRTPALQNLALASMCTGMARWIASPASDRDPFESVVASLRAVKTAKDQLIRRQIKGDAPKPLNDAAATLADATLGYARSVVNNPSLDRDGRTLAGRLQDAATSLSQLATGFGG